VVEPRRVTRLTLVLVVLAATVLLVAGALAVDTGAEGETETEVPHVLVEPRPGDNVLWPFTSSAKRPETRTLAINVIVHGDEDLLRYYLTDRRGATWNETSEEWTVGMAGGNESRQVRFNGSLIDWTTARGSTRYTYVHDFALTREANETVRVPHQALSFHTKSIEGSPGGRWIRESYQLHDGDYFGKRYHLRVYESPYETDNWIAIQAHSEHFDWFRLRHTVHGIDSARERVENEFMGSPYVADVWRKYLGNDGGPNFDGWATVVELRDMLGLSTGILGAFVVGAVAVGNRRRGRRWLHVRWTENRYGRPGAADDGYLATALDSRPARRLLETVGRRRFVLGLRLLADALLFGSLVAVYLFVRAAGIFAEHQAPWLSPKVIAGLLYLFLVTALPLCAYRFARHKPPVRSFVVAASGVGTAIWLDYVLLSVKMLPLQVILHRVGVAVALGLIAAGATTISSTIPRRNRFVLAGGLLWLFLLVAPVVGWL